MKTIHCTPLTITGTRSEHGRADAAVGSAHSSPKGEQGSDGGTHRPAFSQRAGISRSVRQLARRCATSTGCRCSLARPWRATAPGTAILPGMRRGMNRPAHPPQLLAAADPDRVGAEPAVLSPPQPEAAGALAAVEHDGADPAPAEGRKASRLPVAGARRRCRSGCPCSGSRRCERRAGRRCEGWRAPERPRRARRRRRGAATTGVRGIDMAQMLPSRARAPN